MSITKTYRDETKQKCRLSTKSQWPSSVVVVVVSNGWLWLYAISLLASQYSCTMFFILPGLSMGHCGRWASFITESSCWHMVQLAEGRILILCRWAARQSWPIWKSQRLLFLVCFCFDPIIPFHFFPFIICCVCSKNLFLHIFVS